MTMNINSFSRFSRAFHELFTLEKQVTMRVTKLFTLFTTSREFYIKKNKNLLSVKSVKSEKLPQAIGL
jgi:hypothetical protein